MDAAVPQVSIGSVFSVAKDKFTVRAIRKHDVLVQSNKSGAIVPVPHRTIEQALAKAA